MPLEITEQQESNLQQTATRPVYIIRHAHSGVDEYASCSGEIVYDGQLYDAGGANVTSMQDSRQATFTLPATPDRIAQVKNGTWRDGDCVIYHIPGLPSDDGTYDTSEAILVLSGKIRTSGFTNGRITVNATHTNNLNKISPRHTWDEVCPHVPAAGTEIAWEGDRLILTTRDARGRSNGNGLNPALNARGRLPAAELKNLSQPSESLTLTATGSGAVIPVIHGEKPAPGNIIAIGSISGDLVLAVGWGFGEIQSFEDTYINGESVPGGVTVTHYRGSTGQGVDPTLATAIAAFNSDMVLRTPEGDIGCAYSVFRIPSGQLSAAPTFMAVLQGKAVYDPRVVGSNDAFASDTQLSVVFDGDDGTTSATDDSQNDHSISFIGDAVIQGGLLFLPGTSGSRVEIADDGSLELGSSDFTIEVKEHPASLSGRVELYRKGTSTGGGTASFLLRREDDELRLWISSNGTSWNIADSRLITTLTGTNEYTVSIERSGSNFSAYVNGTQEDSFTSASSVFNSSDSLVLGDLGAPSPGAGSIRSVRTTIGSNRYGDDYPASGVPFSNYAIYSDNSALCMGDLASNPIYGMGANVVGLESAADWNDTLLDDTVPRCRISMLLTDPRRTAEYLDLYGDYSECVWFNEGPDIRIKPDKIIDADNPCGQLLNTNTEFQNGDTDWLEAGSGSWSISTGEASIDGTQTGGVALYQTVVLNPGESVVIEYEIDSISAGTVRSYYRDETNAQSYTGDEQTSAGAYSDLHHFPDGVATPITVRVGVVSNADAVATLSRIKVNRLYWHETGFIKDSLSIEGIDESDAPTSVSTRYTVPSGSSPNWQESPTDPIRLPGVSEGEIPNVETTLHLQGVYRLAEANNKANARLQRYRNRVRYTWQSLDYAVRFRKADVIQLDLEHHGIDELVWVQSVEMTSYGRYKITGFRYDENHYPSELILPEGTGVVPVGAIVPLSGSTVPDGWENYTAANGRYILGAGSTYDPGDTGGSDTFSGWSGNTSSVDTHGGASYDTFRSPETSSPQTGGSIGPRVDTDNPSLVHAHTYNTGSFQPDPLRRNNRLIIKTGSAETFFPADAQVFGLPNIVAANVSRLTDFANRLLRANSSTGNGGQSQRTLSFTTGEYNDGHDHFTRQFFSNRNSDLIQSQWWSEESGGGLHSHSFTGTLSRSIKLRRIALYGGSDNFAVVPGMMVLWSGSVGSLPSDWILCDGANGTPDARDYFIEISALGQEGTATGNNTIAFSGTSSTVSHDHLVGGGNVTTGRPRVQIAHSNAIGHNHTMSRSASWIPAYYALALIMYAPS